MNRYSNLITGCLCAFTCETIYGLSYLFTKQAAESAGALVLKEPFTTYQIVGAAVILAGIYIANTYHEKENR